MEPRKDQKRPPAVMDGVIRLLLPPASREAVAGDLWERYSSPLQYAADALHALPFVIVSQIRRNANLPVLSLQAFVLFACLGGFVPPTLTRAPWAVAALPTLAAFAALVLRDAYRLPGQLSVSITLTDALIAAWSAAFCEAVLMLLSQAGVIGPNWLLPWPIVMLGLFALPALCVLRTSGETAALRGEPLDLGTEYQRFVRRTCWQNRMEMGALLVVAVGSALFLLHFRTDEAPLVWPFIALECCVLAYLALRGWANPLPADMDMTEQRVFYGAELTRRHRIRRFMWWFWFAPLFIGLVLNFVVRGFVRADPVLACIGLLLMALLAVCIVGLLRDRERTVQKRVASLIELHGPS